MGGLFLDVYVVYLVRQLIRYIRSLGSKDWPTAIATVTSSTCSDYFTVAEITYSYDHDGSIVVGGNYKPFILSHSAKEYAHRFPEGATLVVRLKPEDQYVSIVRDADQMPSPVSVGSAN